MLFLLLFSVVCIACSMFSLGVLLSGLCWKGLFSCAEGFLSSSFLFQGVFSEGSVLEGALLCSGALIEEGVLEGCSLFGGFVIEGGVLEDVVHGFFVERGVAEVCCFLSRRCFTEGGVSRWVLLRVEFWMCFPGFVYCVGVPAVVSLRCVSWNCFFLVFFPMDFH